MTDTTNRGEEYKDKTFVAQLRAILDTIDLYPNDMDMDELEKIEAAARVSYAEQIAPIRKDIAYAVADGTLKNAQTILTLLELIKVLSSDITEMQWLRAREHVEALRNGKEVSFHKTHNRLITHHTQHKEHVMTSTAKQNREFQDEKLIAQLRAILGTMDPGDTIMPTRLSCIEQIAQVRKNIAYAVADGTLQDDQTVLALLELVEKMSKDIREIKWLRAKVRMEQQEQEGVEPQSKIPALRTYKY